MNHDLVIISFRQCQNFLLPREVPPPTIQPLTAGVWTIASGSAFLIPLYPYLHRSAISSAYHSRVCRVPDSGAVLASQSRRPIADRSGLSPYSVAPPERQTPHKPPGTRPGEENIVGMLFHRGPRRRSPEENDRSIPFWSILSIRYPCFEIDLAILVLIRPANRDRQSFYSHPVRRLMVSHPFPCYRKGNAWRIPRTGAVMTQ